MARRKQHWTTHLRGTPKKLGEMNKLETRYAEVLTARKLTGEILSWWYEPMRLRLAKGVSYLADFMVMTADRTLELHETKGYEADKARVKRLTAAEMFPFRFFKVTEPKRGRGFEIVEFGPSAKDEK